MSDAPEWVNELVERASALLQIPEDLPVGCHCHAGDDGWEISLFLMRVEVYGGGRDGQHVNLPFHCDLAGLPELLDEVESVTWQSARIDSGDDLGAHISVAGHFEGEPVWVRILAEAPRAIPTAGLIDSRTLEVHPQ